jgi:hypothetical protein
LVVDLSHADGQWRDERHHDHMRLHIRYDRSSRLVRQQRERVSGLGHSPKRQMAGDGTAVAPFLCLALCDQRRMCTASSSLASSTTRRPSAG